MNEPIVAQPREQRAEDYQHLDNLTRQLNQLHEQQREWLNLQHKLDEAADFLESYGIRTERHPWCWNDSPHAKQITAIERALRI